MSISDILQWIAIGFLWAAFLFSEWRDESFRKLVYLKLNIFQDNQKQTNGGTP